MGPVTSTHFLNCLFLDPVFLALKWSCPIARHKIFPLLVSLNLFWIDFLVFIIINYFLTIIIVKPRGCFFKSLSTFNSTVFFKYSIIFFNFSTAIS